MKILANPMILRAVIVFVCATFAFLLGLLLMRALKKNDRADLYLVAVRSEYRGKGVNAILMDRMHAVFNRLGITRVESNPELETNADVQGQWKYYEKRQHKRRRVFIKQLEQEGLQVKAPRPES